MDLNIWKEKLDSWFDDHELEILSFLERIVNMDSFSHDACDVNKVGEVIAERMRFGGFNVDIIPKLPPSEDESWISNLGNLVCAHDHDFSAGPGVGFIGHMDTVFPSGTAKARPFHYDKGLDKATGPGILDMKSGLVINMFTAFALKELGLMPVPMTLTFSPDEELGSPSTTPLLGKVLNGAHAVICTEPGYPGGGITLERKGSGHFLLEIQGKAAHAGRNYEDGASAILEIAHKILAFDKHLDLANDTTVNTGLIDGGISANSIAPNAKARIHFTYKTVEAGRDIEEKIRKDCETTFVKGTKTRISGGMRLYPLTPTPKVQALYSLAENAGKILNLSIRKERSKGAAESGYCSSILDLPVLCSMGAEGLGLHSENEYITPSTIIPRAKVVALTALQAAYCFEASAKVEL